MKQGVYYILLLGILIGFTSVKPSHDLKMDWSRITDKDYIVTYVKVQHDSSSQYAIETNARIYNTNDNARLLTKNSVKLIKELITNDSYFNDEPVGNICDSYNFSHAFVVTQNGEIIGIINLACQKCVLVFEPDSKFGETLRLNGKGLKLLSDILNLKK